MSTQIKHKQVRLPAHIIPERYEIMICPDLEGFTFYGQETIYLKIDEPITQIKLHSKDLDIESAEFITAKGKEAWAGKISYDQLAETTTFTFPKTIPPGKGQLKLAFKGILNDKMRGFYRSRYLHDGKEKYLATSQFEATDARRAFPCFDEPAQKAIFDVTLMIPQGLTAISNTLPTKIAEHESGYQLVKFAPTPKMSTYLLAFIVGDFEYIEGKTKEGILVRVFVTPGKKHQAEFALKTAIKILSFYNSYFGIKYPLPVLDLIAIPDFAAGAMENWGAVTYRETALLVDPEHSSLQTKQWVALVIAHELAHQWFGNLVTMEWWTHLWLNEGFASYIEYLAVDHVFPQWDIWTQFVFNDLGAALKLDALANTHPIEIEVHHPGEIGEIFDAVSYSKGASVIRMLADFLGEKDFRQGLRRYLKKHQYGNAVTGDLWQSLKAVSGRPVGRIMHAWTQLPGYPILRATKTPRGLLLEQSRFFSSPLSRAKSKSLEHWPIPLVYGPASGSGELRVLMDSKKLLVKDSNKTLKLNKGESGMLAVRYPEQYLPDLEQAVKDKKLQTRDRLGLLRDYLALAEAGELPTVEVLELAPAYRGETDYTVWLELASGLDTLHSLLSQDKLAKSYEAYADSLFTRISPALGWNKKPGESHTQTLLRTLVIAQRAKLGDKKTLQASQKLFNAFLLRKKPIDPDIRGSVYRSVAYGGSAAEHRTFINLYKQSHLHEEKNRIGRALASFKQKNLLQQTLQFSLTKHVRLQDAIMIICGVGINLYGRQVMWEFTKKHWADLVSHYGQGGHLLPRLIQPLGTFTSEAKAKEIEGFFKKHPAPGGTRAILQTLERVRSNAAWLKRDRGNIEKWLKRNAKRKV